MTTYSFSQVDVFGHEALRGNPVAVVHDADGLDDAQMSAFARWTNLSETTFLLSPTQPGADYRLRIFTPDQELPFAGHPTLGSAHAWFERGGRPHAPDGVVQECGAGPVEVRRDGDRLAFRAPAFLREGPADADLVRQVLDCLGPDAAAHVVDSSWIDNGPGWLGLQLDSAAAVLALAPRFDDLEVDTGVIGPHEPGEAESIGAGYEVRAFCPGRIGEDPVTGSLNAGFGLWLTRAGALPPDYVVRQGTVLGADGRVHVSTDATGGVWVAGGCRTIVSGTVDL
ncbi:MAG: PhzF family phenazine biosynthesis protein [Marmoricola sp.]|nr:PhzF family phenazine biosynthesis protein [Marmoricola sp.]